LAHYYCIVSQTKYVYVLEQSIILVLKPSCEFVSAFLLLIEVIYHWMVSELCDKFYSTAKRNWPYTVDMFNFAL